MPRPNITTDQIAALNASTVRPALFVQATFRSGPIFVWTGLGSIAWNGQTWVGLGALGSVSTIEEGTTVEAKGITLTLSGIDANLLTMVMGEFQVGLPVTVYLGLFDSNGALIDTPLTMWAGMMDQPTIDIDGQKASISIACENKLIEMNVAVDRRYTAEDQQIDFPGDKGFNFVNGIQDVTIYWGHTPSSKNNL